VLVDKTAEAPVTVCGVQVPLAHEPDRVRKLSIIILKVLYK